MTEIDKAIARKNMLALFEESARKNVEAAIDLAMSKAFGTLEALRKQEDPYAMHKAVESVPTEVLIEIIRKRTIRYLENQCQPTIEADTR